MPDTARTLASLQALLADNTTGDISPQDMRDFVVSALGSHGSIRVGNGAAVAQTGIGTTATAVTGWDTNGPAADVTVDHTLDKVTVGVAGDYLIGFHLSIESLTASATYDFEIFTGATPTAADIACKITTAATPLNTTVAGMSIITLAAADDVFLYVTADAAARAMTPVNGSLFVRRVA